MFWIFFLIFYFSYLFRVLFLGFFVILLMLIYISGIVFFKYLVLIIYIRGVVVFILYISCLCWNVRNGFRKRFMLFIVFLIYICDMGLVGKFSDVSEFMVIFLFFRFLFNSLIFVYSLSLFKVSGSLRF